jgi:predicted HicB family RNase H-like nuclease
MEYRGYIGTAEVSIEDGILFGQIECINDLIMYQGQTPAELEAAFHESVDDYLQSCEELGREPDKTFSGTFNIRIGAQRHKRLHIEKVRENKASLNELLCIVIDSYFSKESEHHTHNHHHYHVLQEPEQIVVSRSTGNTTDWTEQSNRPHLRIVQ